MKTPSRPFSYEASKYVLQYLPIEHRLNIRLRCPALRTADSVVPLKIKSLRIENRSFELDDIEYKFNHQPDSFFGLFEYYGLIQIKITNRKSKTTQTHKPKEVRGLNTTRSFLMHKLLSGRRTPVLVENFEVKMDEQYSNKIESNLQFPLDLKMKVENLEMFRLNEYVIQQLSRRIVGDSLKTFKVLNHEDLGDTRFRFPLIQTAQKMDITINSVVRWSFKSTPAFPQSEIIVSDGCYGWTSCHDSILIVIMIEARLRSNVESVTNITIYIDEKLKDDVLDKLLKVRPSRSTIVDDAENNQYNIPCVCFPMSQEKELNVYGIPGTRTDTILKVKVMPKGSARANPQEAPST